MRPTAWLTTDRASRRRSSASSRSKPWPAKIASRSVGRYVNDIAANSPMTLPPCHRPQSMIPQTEVVGDEDVGGMQVAVTQHQVRGGRGIRRPFELINSGVRLSRSEARSQEVPPLPGAFSDEDSASFLRVRPDTIRVRSPDSRSGHGVQPGQQMTEPCHHLLALVRAQLWQQAYQLASGRFGDHHGRPWPGFGGDLADREHAGQRKSGGASLVHGPDLGFEGFLPLLAGGSGRRHGTVTQSGTMDLVLVAEFQSVKLIDGELGRLRDHLDDRGARRFEPSVKGGPEVGICHILHSSMGGRVAPGFDPGFR